MSQNNRHAYRGLVHIFMIMALLAGMVVLPSETAEASASLASRALAANSLASEEGGQPSNVLAAGAGEVDGSPSTRDTIAHDTIAHEAQSSPTMFPTYALPTTHVAPAGVSLADNDPTFTLQADKSSVDLLRDTSESIVVNATYENGEQDTIHLYMNDIPAGVEWSLDRESFGPGQSATLVVTATESVPPGDYQIVLAGTDYEQEKLLTLPLSVGGFDLVAFQPAQNPGDEPLWDFDRWNTKPYTQVNFYVLVQGANWSDPVNVFVDPAFQTPDLSVDLSQPSVSISTSITATVTVITGTSPVTHRIPLMAVSQGVTQTLPLTITVNEDTYHSDLKVLVADGPQNDEVVAGETFTVTTVFYNGGYRTYQSFDNIFHLLWMPTPYLPDIISRTEQSASAASCLGPFDDPGHRVHACGFYYPVAPGEQSGKSTFVFEVTPQTAEGTTLDMILQASANLYSGTPSGPVDIQSPAWTSDPADTRDLAFQVTRRSDLALQATVTGTLDSSPLFSSVLTYTAVVSQTGPSNADDVQIKFHLPAGVDLTAGSPGCTQSGATITCAAGSVAAGSQTTVTATVTVQPDNYQSEIRTAIVATSASNDPVFNNNFYTAKVTCDGGCVPEIDLTGMGLSIGNGDTTPDSTDDTDFGTMVVGDAPVVHTFTISNTNRGDLTLGAASLATGGAFTLTQPVSSTVAGGQATTFTVTFDPTAAGSFTDTVSIANNDGDENPYTFVVSGTGTAPEIDVTGNTDFGSAEVGGTPVTRTITISNTGTADLTLGAASLATGGAFTLTQPVSSTVAGGQATTLTVTFDPTAAGSFTDTVSIANNDGDENPYTFVVSGTGTAPRMDVTGNTDFGVTEAGGTPVTRTFTISNTGTADLTLGTASLTTGDPFTMTQPLSVTVSAGQSTTFDVIFNPTAAGSFTDTVSIVNNDSEVNPYIIIVSGVAEQTATVYFFPLIFKNGMGLNTP